MQRVNSNSLSDKKSVIRNDEKNTERKKKFLGDSSLLRLPQFWFRPRREERKTGASMQRREALSATATLAWGKREVTWVVTAFFSGKGENAMSVLTHIMQRNLLTTPGETSVADAAKLMKEKNIGALLIEQDGEPAGILTDTDIVRKGVADRKDLSSLPVKTIMTIPLKGMDITQTVQDAHDMMADLSVRHLVVREAGKVVGIVSVRDLLLYFKNMSESQEIYSEPNINQD